VRARLAFAALTVFAAAAIVVWGLLPGKVPGLRSAASARTPASSSASASPSASPSTAQNLTSNMHEVFDAKFRGSALNSSVWDTCYPWADQSAGCTNFGNASKEFEWYLPSQVHVSGGVLSLTATRERTSGTTKEGSPKVYVCRSGMVTTHPSFNFKYGYVQVVAHISNGTGTWPALWLAASDYAWPPEIDMLEHWGSPRDSSGMFFHPVGAGQVVQALPPEHYRVTGGWQTFAVDWTPSKVTWYLGGKAVFSVTQHVPHQKMYFIANVAAFNKRCSGTLEIRSVKVWQN
jgi:beta-glucanase (GH16 family)